MIDVTLVMFSAGCAGDVNVKKKVGDFGSTFGASAEEQNALNWFTQKYGDPTVNSGQPPQFVEPLITSGLTANLMPVDKITVFPVNGGSVYFWVFYQHFKKGTPITVTWTYVENGKVVSTVNEQTGDTYGRFIVEFEKPDSGWGKGRQQITISGSGATTSVDFTIGDSLQTVSLPYTGTGTTTTPRTVTTVTTKAPTTPASSTQPVKFGNENGNGVSNNPTQPTVFTFATPVTITTITNYHWNGGKGTASPGKISLKHSDGTVYGPWSTSGTPGQGGVPNAYWTANPSVTIKAGKYTVIDSDPSTWGQNPGSGNAGMSWGYSTPAIGGTTTTSSPAPASDHIFVLKAVTFGGGQCNSENDDKCQIGRKSVQLKSLTSSVKDFFSSINAMYSLTNRSLIIVVCAISRGDMRP